MKFSSLSLSLLTRNSVLKTISFYSQFVFKDKEFVVICDKEGTECEGCKTDRTCIMTELVANLLSNSVE